MIPLAAEPFSDLPSLALTRLQLSHFRNYSHLSLDCAAPMLVLTGPNGAGKTNILEAVSLLVPGKGLHKSRLSELVQQGTCEGWAVAAEAVRDGIPFRIGTGQLPGSEDGEKRIVRIDGENARSQGQLARVMSCLWQTPQMDQLFMEGPSERRFFFDRLTSSFDTAHGGHLARYERAMRERNRLLWEGRMDDQWLSALERQMAEQSAAIAAARLQCMEALRGAMAELHESFPQAALALSGDAETPLQQGVSALEAEEGLVIALARSRGQDREMARSSYGAHRSEWMVTHPTGQEAALCSTGQQKVLLLSILLAQARATRVRQGITPLLLLDEVVSHLDRIRRQALFEELVECGAQCWLTGTDVELFTGSGVQGAFFHVEDGRVTA